MNHPLGLAHPQVLSVNVGPLVPSEHTSSPRGTAIDKRPVERIEVRDPGPKQGGAGSGVIGDEIGDRRHHGGDRQAVYAFAREELDRWSGELARELSNGSFGENLTTCGIDVDAAVVGTSWRVGTALLVVTGPRIPCRTFAGHMREPRWIRRFTERGRTGVYLAVVEPGTIQQADPIIAGPSPAHGITVPEVFQAFMGDVELAQRVVAARILGASHHQELVELIDRRGG